MRPVRLLGGLVALSLPLGLSLPASADTLPGGADNRDFAASQGEWTGAATYDGLCVPAVTCAVAVNDFVAAGGTGGEGDGYVRTQFGGVLSTFAATSTGTWTGPSFTYRGNAGKQPEDVRLDLALRPDVAALLGIELLNQATYRVDLVDETGGPTVAVVPATEVTGGAEWTAVPTAHIDPDQLTLGHAYRIRITTSYTAALGLLATGEVGFDDVRLTTSGTAGGSDDGAPGGGGPGGGGGSAGGANGGSGVVSAPQLHQLGVRKVLPPAVRVVRNRQGTQVRVKVTCVKKAAPKACRVTLKGLAKGKKSPAATKTKVVTLKAGKSRVVVLKVKPRFAKKYLRAKRVMLKSTIKVGKVRTIVVKQVKKRR